MVVRRAALGVLTLAAAALVAGPALAGPSLAAGATGPVPVVVLNGRGWGHGVGMSQDGAYWEARAGLSALSILGGFYPGVGMGRAGGLVRVVVVDGGGASAVVGFPGGGQIRDAVSGAQSPGFPVNVPAGGQVQLAGDGAHWSVTGVNFTLPPLRLTAFVPTGSTLPVPVPSTTTTVGPLPTTTTTAPPTTTTRPPTTLPPTTVSSPTTTTRPPPPPAPPAPAPPGPPTQPAPRPPAPAPPGPAVAVSGRPLWAVPAGSGLVTVPGLGRSYRGVVQTAWGAGGIQLINQLDVESYLKGMGEVLDASWPQAALQTQAIAARTYALRAMQTSGQLCADDRCQVYLGAQAEYPAMDLAVDATAGRVLVYGGQLASALYSANGGGFEADPVEAFGNTGAHYPYLRPAPYETQNPMPWTATIALSDVGSRLGYPGAVTAVAVTQKGPSGRATAVTISGNHGALVVPGYQFAAALGLRSTLFSPTLGTAATAPPPPPSQSLIQEAPGAVVAAPTAGAPSHNPASSHTAALLAALGALGLVSAPTGRFAWRARGRRRPIEWVVMAVKSRFRRRIRDHNQPLGS